MFSLILCLWMVLCPMLAYAVPAAQYTITDLGEVDPTTLALDKTAAALVALQVLNGVQRAVVLGALAEILQVLPDNDGDLIVFPQGTDRGRVVGSIASRAAGTAHAFLFEPGSGIRDLGTLGGPELVSLATDVNGQTTVVGYGNDPLTGSPTAPIVWPQGGAAQRLPLLGGTTGLAFALNDTGAAVGQSSTATAIQHAAMWILGGVVDLQDLPEVEASVAFDVNDVYQTVGIAQTRTTQAFRWRVGTGMALLTPLAGDTSASAASTNFQGDTVGQSFTAPFLQRPTAVIWSELDTVAVALATLVPTLDDWQLTAAVGINDLGQIAGLGTRAGATHAFLLTPVTMPAASGLEAVVLWHATRR